VIIVHGTRAFRDRVPGPAVTPGETSTTVLGAWYATILRWRRPAALLVNELTLLPLVLPLAPAKTLLTRFPDVLAELLAAHRVPPQLIEVERAQALEHRLAATANRSLVGVMNEFAHLADLDRAVGPDLLRLSHAAAHNPLRTALPAAHQPRPGACGTPCRAISRAIPPAVASRLEYHVEPWPSADAADR
jgi:hypothetical protein